MIKKPFTICYFGLYAPAAPRDKIYLEELRKRGTRVIECVDNSAGFSKFFRLAKKHRALAPNYDVLWVGYLSAMLVPLAWFLTRKKIVFNALSSWYENAVIDRGLYRQFSPKAAAIWCLDFLAFHLARVALVESDNQKKFLMKTFHLSPKKLAVVFTGADPEVFFPEPGVKKRERFTVLFRGIFAPATGVEFVLEAARLLKNKPIDFIIIGWGPLLPKVQERIKAYALARVTLITHFLEPQALRHTMLSCHVMLGQFGDHPRMERTIQHKTSEALALGMPYITRDSRSNRELLTDSVNCLFVPHSNPEAIAEKIVLLERDSALRDKLSESALKLSSEKLSAGALASIVEKLLR